MFSSNKLPQILSSKYHFLEKKQILDFFFLLQKLRWQSHEDIFEDLLHGTEVRCAMSYLPELAGASGERQACPLLAKPTNPQS